MNIVLCDDDVKFLNKLKECISKILEEKQENFNIMTFLSGEEFLKYYEKMIDIDIVFLDIMMKDITGIQVARRIREQDSCMQIYFITSISSYVLEGYDVRAANYLIKPVKYYKLCRELNKTIELIHNKNKKFILEKNDLGIFKIKLEEISYIETYERNTLIHTSATNILSYKNMKKHTELLGEDFCRIHESYIVNLSYIKSLFKMNVELENGEVLPVSKHRKKNIIEQISIYYGNLI
ncbi:MAG: LytTR family DNA-binding domain-containing protein [Anaerocolumna sp.]